MHRQSPAWQAGLPFLSASFCHVCTGARINTITDAVASVVLAWPSNGMPCKDSRGLWVKWVGLYRFLPQDSELRPHCAVFCIFQHRPELPAWQAGRTGLASLTGLDAHTRNVYWFWGPQY
jgi:hypothetical protein